MQHSQTAITQGEGRRSFSPCQRARFFMLFTDRWGKGDCGRVCRIYGTFFTWESMHLNHRCGLRFTSCARLGFLCTNSLVSGGRAAVPYDAISLWTRTIALRTQRKTVSLVWWALCVLAAVHSPSVAFLFVVTHTVGAGVKKAFRRQSMLASACLCIPLVLSPGFYSAV